MWIYEKKLEFPIKITTPDARLVKIMIEQYGGPDGILFLWYITFAKNFTFCERNDIVI